MFSLFDSLRLVWNKLKEQNQRGIQWVGTDGLINMETSALLTIFLMIFLPVVWAMIISFMAVMTKCIVDKRRGHENEKHDFICASIGVIIGAILGPAHGAMKFL